MWQASGLAPEFSVDRVGAWGWVDLAAFGVVMTYLLLTLFMVQLSISRLRALLPAILTPADLEAFGEKTIRMLLVSRLQHYSLAALIIFDLLAHFVGVPTGIAIAMWAATAIPVWVGRRVQRASEGVLDLPVASEELGHRYREVCKVWRRNAFPAWLGQRA